MENKTYKFGELLSVLKWPRRMQTFSWGRWNRDCWNNSLQNLFSGVDLLTISFHREEGGRKA